VMNEPQSASKLVAPVRHTVVLILIFLTISMAGVLYQRRVAMHPRAAQPSASPRQPRVAPLYISLIAAEWGIVYYIWAGGLKQTGTRWRDLIGGRWNSARDVALDVALALALWVVWLGVQIAVSAALGASPAKPIETYFPRHPLSIVLWVALSLSAGFCEEVAFRGHFQRQFRALMGSGLVAVLLQGFLFGISHGYQGIEPVIMITIFGVLYGLLALWRGSLRPGMITHGWSDIYAGLATLLLHR
jgi:uncharacterized protein